MLALIEIARWIVAAAFVLILIWASATDIKYRRIPNWTVVAIVILYIPWIFVGPGVSLSLSFAAGAIAFFTGVTLYALGLLGAGDSKLITAVALFVGLAKLPQFALATAVAGGILALVMILSQPKRVLVMLNMRGRADFGRNVPYGVAIAVGALLIVFGGLLHIPIIR
jgi:prepilin peptidase CpaA